MPDLICSVCRQRDTLKSEVMKLLPRWQEYICSGDCLLVIAKQCKPSGLVYTPKPREHLANTTWWYVELKRGFRSSYEVTFAKFLRKRGVVFDYEPYTFFMDCASYTPDFYLPDYDCFIEVKGAWTMGQKAKMAKFRQTFPEVNLLVAPWTMRGRIAAMVRDAPRTP